MRIRDKYFNLHAALTCIAIALGAYFWYEIGAFILAHL